MRTILTAALLISLGILPAVVAEEPVRFEEQIRPLLLKHCGECHGPKNQESGLRLDARHTALKGGDSGPSFVIGKSDESELLRRLLSSDPDERMPPMGPALPADDIELLRRWIDEGADWPESDYDREAAKDPRLQHWAFQPLNHVAIPAVTVTSPVEAATAPLNEIDRFILISLSGERLSLNPEADPRTLVRRMFLDMTGLPPTFERISAFTTSNEPNKWNGLVEEMLASPRYGERWAQHWLDVVRYADTHGFEVNTPRDHAWRYRDYVIRALNEDTPYDQFIREQLAGDVLGADEATGFMVASAVLLPGQIGADEESRRLARQDALDEIIVGTSSTLLGLTVGCARCHDHKFDPITARDYYSMQAFFAGVDYGDRPIRDVHMQQRLNEAAAMEQTIAVLQQKLQSFEPLACSGRTLILDEEDMRFVTFLKQPNGPGTNPVGSQRGYQDDPGSAERIGNISRGRYTWWNNVSGEDVMTWNPGVAGRFSVWISWGAHGSGVHTRDARYVLDRDGDLTTKGDQSDLARIDQYYAAGVREGETEQVPLWSGVLPVGIVDLSATSKLILRSGDTGTGITADVIVLQETAAAESGALPRLRAPVSPLQNTDRFAPVTARFVRFTSFETVNSNQHEPCIDELELYAVSDPSKNIALASRGVVATSSGNYSDIGIHQLKHVNDGLYGNSHSWISNQQGGGWVQLELPEPTEIDRIIWGRDRDGKFQDRLALRYELSVSPDGESWTTVARSDDRFAQGTPFDPVQTLLRNQAGDVPTELPAISAELDGLQSEKSRLETPQMVYGGTFRDPDVTWLLRRGDPEQRVEQTVPAIPAFLSLNGESNQDEIQASGRSVTGSSDGATPEQQRRLTLADWIASPENPLTARVMVNRIWLYHFGRGLVDTPSDFGVNGMPPSHPELLDWLASEFIRSGWSVKHIHRLILNSATYRQSSRIAPEAATVDRDNRLLWRFPSRRLESEAIRDCMLAISGELNLRMGGPGFSFFKARGGLDGFPPVDTFTAEELRRMVYAHKVRMEQVPVFGPFDCPDAGQSTPRRGRSTTAIQALNLFNSSFVIERADKFAASIDVQNSDARLSVNRAFETAFGRSPSEDELTASIAVASRHGIATLCRVLFNSSEFLFIP